MFGPPVVGGNRHSFVTFEKLEQVLVIPHPVGDVGFHIVKGVGPAPDFVAFPGDYPASGWHNLHQPPGSHPTLGLGVSPTLGNDEGQDSERINVVLGCLLLHE